MNKFLESHKLSKLTQDKTENLNRTIRSKEIKSVIKNPPTKKSPWPNGFTGEYHQIFKECLTDASLTLPKIIQKRREHLPTHSMSPILS